MRSLRHLPTKVENSQRRGVLFDWRMEARILARTSGQSTSPNVTAGIDETKANIENQRSDAFFRAKSRSPTVPFYLKLYIATVPVFFLIDMVWLGLVARTFYQKRLGFILSDQVNWTAAIIFYLIFISGIILFAVWPALEAKSLGRAALLGGLFGFFTYATYDLTNLATIKNWPVAVVLVDIAWGFVLCSAVATTSFLIANWLK